MLDSRIRWHVALAEWLRGSLVEAEHAFTSVIARWRAAGDPGLAAPSCHLLGQVQLAQGRLDAALGTYRQALEIATLPGRPVLPVAGIGYVGLAKVAYQRNELNAALGQVTEGHRTVSADLLHPAVGHRPGGAGVDSAGPG
jgi:LuxR family transcriptional regulator, maltose regulon positive regulatory protein